MPRMSSTARDAARQVQVIAADASNGAALAARLLAALEPGGGVRRRRGHRGGSRFLLFTPLLAYRGDRLPPFAFFLRDVYLVAREPDWLSFPRLLRDGGGAAVFHERFELWLRAHPPAMSQSAFTAFWRAQQSPPGGGLRFGLAHRGNWVAVLQLARWTPVRDSARAISICSTAWRPPWVWLSPGPWPGPPTPALPGTHLQRAT